MATGSVVPGRTALLLIAWRGREHVPVDIPKAVVVRTAVTVDVAGIVGFGRAVILEHYAPLIGAGAAHAQVEQWWGEGSIAAAVDAGLMVITEQAGQVIGVGQRGRMDGEHVIWKLYLHRAHRGRGLGRRLLGALVDQLPDDARRVWIEHVAANERAGAFYEREGFTIERIEASAAGDAGTDQVWRVRPVALARPGGAPVEQRDLFG